MEVIGQTKPQSKYYKQIAYDKKRREEDPEYHRKKNDYIIANQKKRYQEDPVYRAKMQQYQKERQKLIYAIYKQNKDKIE